MNGCQWEQLGAVIAEQSSYSSDSTSKERNAFSGHDKVPSISTMKEVMRVDMGTLTGMPMKDFSAWTTSPFVSGILAILLSKRRTADEARVAVKCKESWKGQQRGD